MLYAVYLPLLLPLLATWGARLLATRCEPRLATWLLTLSSVVLGAASTLCLGLLAATAVIRIPLFAQLGHWSARSAQLDDPTELSVALLAALLVGGAALAGMRMVARRTRAIVAAAVEAACMPAHNGLVVVEDAAPDAFAVPGLPGRIVVSTGMLDTLEAGEHDILLAHERAHLAAQHHLFVAFAQLGATVNPFLRPLATTVTYTIERWADERAAETTGDRTCVARAVGKAALATRHTPARTPGATLGVLGPRRRNPLAAAGPVPRRVAALLAPPLTRHPGLTLATGAVLAATTWASAEAVHDLHLLLTAVGAG
ncbi:M56 family metallopeptidase [Streptomyces sp. NPDC058045]|uniref:M56 family metallopeptidase n=1 Tax=Streptomyces sp. NPDC058045 TaxID=3346311 RepID=UPI0036E70CC2